MNESKLACFTGPWGNESLVTAITEVSRAGFAGIECLAPVVLQYEDRLHVFEEILQSVRLRLAALLQPLNLLDQDHADEQVERAVNAARFASAAGARQVTICHLQPLAETIGEEQISVLCAIVEEIGQRCAEFGVEICFLPRADHGIGTEREIARFLASTKAEYVKLAIDTAEIALAGGQPHRVVKAHADRLRLVRYRDASAKRRARGPGGKPIPTPGLGRGIVEFEPFSKALLAAGYDGWIVLDVTGESAPAGEATEAGHRYLIKRSGLFPIV